MVSSDSKAIPVKVQICILCIKTFSMGGNIPFIAEHLVQLRHSLCHATYEERYLITDVL